MDMRIHEAWHHPSVGEIDDLSARRNCGLRLYRRDLVARNDDKLIVRHCAGIGIDDMTRELSR